MSDYRHIDLILFKLRDPRPECGHEFAKVIRDLDGQDSTDCPLCRHSVSLKEYKGAIEHLVETAAELDILTRKRQ